MAWEISTTPLRNAIRHHHTLPVTLTEVLCHCGQLEQMDGQHRHLIGTGDNKDGGERKDLNYFVPAVPFDRHAGGK
ncbi:uncharacterized protein CEXT_320511 [Caerostris extrusa]|uniref:Uncharacterized protein n=1 Tax=Caerostris extrusa TaxID=172846 RepID=A0AAV4WIH7_CAEEX|nr:uncharacterized protein CEXT_320511 [Caerostris extrusa]